MNKTFFYKLSLLFFAYTCLSSVIFSQEIPQNLSDNEKIFGLSKIWKEADKNFVFFDQVPELDWDREYQNYLPRILATNSTYEYYKKLQTFCALLKDGHTRVVVPWQLRKIYEQKPAIRTELVDNKVFITEILNDTLYAKGFKIGLEIIAIDGMDIHKYADEKIKPYMFASTKQDLEVQIYSHHLLEGKIDEPVALSVIDDGKTKSLSLDRQVTPNVQEDKSLYQFRVLDNDVGYLKLRGFWGERVNEKFDELFPKIKETRALIIDVSENLGGNSGFAHYILQHFLNEPFETSRWKTRMYLPAFESWGRSQTWFENAGDVISPVGEESRYGKSKPVIVLISEKTYSAGEDFVSAFILSKRGKVVGRPTAGTTGNPIGFAIPGGGGFQICTKRDYLPNGKEFVGYGIEPDIFVKKSLDKDHLLTEARKFISDSAKQ